MTAAATTFTGNADHPEQLRRAGAHGNGNADASDASSSETARLMRMSRRKRTFRALSALLLEACQIDDENESPLGQAGEEEPMFFPAPFLQEMEDNAVNFLVKAERAAHSVLCANNDEDDYGGLDASRDTPRQVENMIRRFPRVLCRKARFHNSDLYPIQILPYSYSDVVDAADDDDNGNAVGTGGGNEVLRTFNWNVRALPFLPLVARLGFESGFFPPEERGGLLTMDGEYSNVLQDISRGSHGEYYNNHNNPDDDDGAVKEENDDGGGNGELRRAALVRERKLEVLAKLRDDGLLRKEDVTGYGLLRYACGHKSSFPESRFRFFLEMDPAALLHPSARGFLPLHKAALNDRIQTFRTVLEAGLNHSKTEGIQLVFRKNKRGNTPYKLACDQHGRDAVGRVLEEAMLLHRIGEIELHPAAAAPRREEDLIIDAADDDRTDLDGVYYFLRRRPDVLREHPSLSAAAAAAPPVVPSSASSPAATIPPSPRKRRSKRARCQKPSRQRRKPAFVADGGGGHADGGGDATDQKKKVGAGHRPGGGGSERKKEKKAGRGGGVGGVGVDKAGGASPTTAKASSARRSIPDATPSFSSRIPSFSSKIKLSLSSTAAASTKKKKGT